MPVPVQAFPHFLRERIRTGRVFRKLDLMLNDSIRETVWLDTLLEAPTKEFARQIKQAEDTRTSQESPGPSANPSFVLNV